jgi:hypothetical protein
MGEIDRRIKGLDATLLGNYDYVPTTINFPKGSISAMKWPPTSGPIEQPRQWSRSNGVADKVFPRELADRLRISYDDSGALDLTECGSATPFISLELVSGVERGEVEFFNMADSGPAHGKVDNYADLTYLLWYYRLGSWESGTCPNYTGRGDGAVVLRCSPADTCTFYGSPDRIGTMWPPHLGPRPSCDRMLLSPNAKNNVPAGGGGFSFTVTQTDCSWTATSNVDWLTTSSGGKGNGTVNYIVAANGTGANRTGTVTVSGYGANAIFTVKQLHF